MMVMMNGMLEMKMGVTKAGVPEWKIHERSYGCSCGQEIRFYCCCSALCFCFGPMWRMAMSW